jgi:gliding motility-associated-like protein
MPQVPFPYMRYLVSSFLFFIFTGFVAYAQDDCATAIELTNVKGWCSPVAAYNNLTATQSTYSPASNCLFGARSHDVWFKFTAIATEINITISGQTRIGSGGTITTPEVQLLEGVCGRMREIECRSDGLNSGAAELGFSGLNVGDEYFFRVDSRFNAQGTFKVCVDNYFPNPTPSSDCPTAVLLCNKDPFVVSAISGVGSVINEIPPSRCSVPGGCTVDEGASVWYKWICEQSGSLSFELTPLNPTDDIDFVLYELPAGLNDCRNKVELRCMMAGENQAQPISSWIACTGPTGLRPSESDISEVCGCTPSSNSYVQSANIVAGRAYTLMVNNFSQTGNGFRMSFGGTSTFKGPNIDFVAAPTPLCLGKDIQVYDQSTTPIGSIVEWRWNFGRDANPRTATGQGPHRPNFTTTGVHNVVLTLQSSEGCFQSRSIPFVVGDSVVSQFTSTNPLCFDSREGSITMNSRAIGGSTVNYRWDNGANGRVLANLGAGRYIVTSTDVYGFCPDIDTITLISPERIVSNLTATTVTCFGGNDASVTANPSKGIPPYRFNFGVGPTTNNTANNFNRGPHNVTVTDANNCTIVDVIEVPSNPRIAPTITTTLATCMGGQDGTVSVTSSGGVPYTQGMPYRYNFGRGFASINGQVALPIGSYNLSIRDSLNCQLDTTYKIKELELLLNPLLSTLEPPKCFGGSDGRAIVAMGNGRSPYFFDWGPTGNFVLRDSSRFNLVGNTYNVRVRDQDGCFGDLALDLNDHPQLLIDSFATDSVRCFGARTGRIQPATKGGVPPYTYNWNDPFRQTTQAAIGLAAGTYTVTINDANGCVFIKDTTIYQNPPIVSKATPKDARCFNEASGSMVINSSGGVPPYKYGIPRPVNQLTPTFSNLLAGRYDVMIQDYYGCQDSIKSILIDQPFQLIVDAGPDYRIQLGDSVQITATVNSSNSITYKWSPPTYLRCPTCRSTFSFPFQDIRYYVSVTDGDGCVAEDSMQIKLDYIYDLYVPNAFTPNGDNYNSLFKPYNYKGLKAIRILRVYSRWGELVYEANNFNPSSDILVGWDGKFHGKDMNPAVFVYYLEAEFLDGHVEFRKGDVTLIR